jgi:hypothetical protein
MEWNEAVGRVGKIRKLTLDDEFNGDSTDTWPVCSFSRVALFDYATQIHFNDPKSDV